jgi:hypothetical protein
MSELNTLKYEESNATRTKPSVWELLIFVPLIIMLLIMADGIFLNLTPERSGYLKMQKVANETYRQYSQRLDAISKKYAKELEAINKEN